MFQKKPHEIQFGCLCGDLFQCSQNGGDVIISSVHDHRHSLVTPVPSLLSLEVTSITLICVQRVCSISSQLMCLPVQYMLTVHQVPWRPIILSTQLFDLSKEKQLASHYFLIRYYLRQPLLHTLQGSLDRRMTSLSATPATHRTFFFTRPSLYYCSLAITKIVSASKTRQ